MTVRRAAAVSGIAIAATLAVSALAAVLWWSTPDGRLSQLSSAASLVLPTAAIAGYLAVVGLAVIVWIPRTRRSSIGFAVGAGTAITSLAVGWSYRIAQNVTAVIWVMLVLAGLSILIAAVVGLVRARRAPGSLMAAQVRGVSEWVIRSGDLVSITVAAAVMFSVGRFGASAWTTLINDFHRYAGSAMIWLSDSGVGADFATKFAGNYADGMLVRASHEKPGSTALLVLASQVSGLEPYQLLTPLSVVFLAALVSCLVVVLRRGFGLGLPASLACTIPPALSLIPLSRVFDAQLGQLLASALLAALLALVSIEPQTSPRAARLGRGALAGIILAAAISSNATLVVSFAPVVALLAAWIATRRGWDARSILRYVIVASVAAVVSSLPFVANFITSIRGQSGGSEGIAVPFPFPLALVGLQPDLSISTMVPFAWAAAFAVAIGWLVLRRPGGLDARFAIATVGASAVMVLALGVAFGFDNYSVHKWFALWIPLVTPLLLGVGLASVASRARAVATATLSVAAGGALLIASHFGYGVANVVSAEVFALADNRTLAQIDVLNVDLNNLYLNSLAPLAMPSSAVRVVDTTYALADSPLGSTFLISSDSLQSRQWQDVQALGGGLSLAHLDLTLDAGETRFAPGDPATGVLFGSWYAPEPEGTWSAPGKSMIVFDVGQELRGSAVTVVIDGVLFSAPGAAGSVDFLLYDEKVKTVSAESEAAQQVSITVPGHVIDAHDNRIVISLSSVSGVSPARVYPAGSTTDTRELVFGLRSITLRADKG